MKKNLIFLVIALLVSLTNFSQNVSGVYNTDYKQMTLNQTDNKVTGTYEGANGKINAILNGNRLVGTWRNSASGKTGNFEFIFNSDFSAFTGKYGYNNATPTKKWNGTKIKSSTSTTIVQTPPPPIANIAGVYSTDYKQMTISQTDNKITGTYEGANGKIQGILSGNKLIGTWNNNASGKTGNFEFIFNSDFSAFTGKYGYNNATPTKKWNGTKTKSSSSTSTTINTQTNLPINIIGSWSSNGSRNHRGRANIWQEGNQFTVIVSWIDEELNLWKSYKGEGKFEGREMHFKVFPAIANGSTVDQGYVYHWTVSSDSNQITGYYTRYGKKTVETTVYYKRVE